MVIMNITDETYVVLTPNSSKGWATNGTSFLTKKAGIVTISFSMRYGDANSSPTTIPEGYRPVDTIRVAAITNSGGGAFNIIGTSGVISPIVPLPGTGWVFFTATWAAHY